MQVRQLLCDVFGPLIFNHSFLRASRECRRLLVSTQNVQEMEGRRHVQQMEKEVWNQRLKTMASDASQ